MFAYFINITTAGRGKKGTLMYNAGEFSGELFVEQHK
jgi:hypothetical protein